VSKGDNKKVKLYKKGILVTLKLVERKIICNFEGKQLPLNLT